MCDRDEPVRPAGEPLPPHEIAPLQLIRAEVRDELEPSLGDELGHTVAA